MSLSPNQANLDQFWYYISERYSIYRKKTIEKLPKPWTTDQAIANWHYCCVYREHDKGTVFLQNILKTPGLSPEDKLYNICLFRLLGSDIEQFEDLCGNHKCLDSLVHEPKYIVLWANSRLTNNKRAMGHGAYLPPAPSYDRTSQTKIEAIIWTTIGYVRSNLNDLTVYVQDAVDMQSVYDIFTAIPGCGNFYAQELAQDVLDAELVQFKDEGNWTNVGPGAERGLRLIFPQIEKSELEDGIRLLRDMHDHKALGLPKPLTLRNVEHNLCELFKYNRVKNGGKNRRRYKYVTSNSS